MVEIGDKVSGNYLELLFNSTSMLIPELVLMGTVLLLVLIDFAGIKYKYIFSIVAVFGFIAAAAFIVLHLGACNCGAKQSLYGGVLTISKIGSYFKLLIVASGVIGILFSTSSNWHKSTYRLQEYNTLIVSVVLSAMLLVMSTHWVSIFLSFESLSICSYLLVLLPMDKLGKEAALKYFLFGGVSGAIMLYGMSLISLSIGVFDVYSLSMDIGNSSLASIGVVLIVLGALFKLAVFPMHIWAPGVYKGMTFPVMGILSIIPKLAGIMMLGYFISTIDVIMILGKHVQLWKLLALVSMIGMTWGNFAALRQKNAKRLMAFSGIAQASLLVGVLSVMSLNAVNGILFYAVVYIFMNFASLILIDMLSTITGSDDIDTFAGTGKKYPLIGVVMLVAMVALIGLPPTAGFTGKLFLFSGIWEAYQTNSNGWMLTLLIVGILNTVVSLFYYLRIPYYMFIRESNIELPDTLSSTMVRNLVVFSSAVALIILFFHPQMLWDTYQSINYLSRYFL